MNTSESFEPSAQLAAGHGDPAQIERFVRFGAAWGYTMTCSAAAFAFMLCGQPVRGWLAMLHPWSWGTLRIAGIRVEVHGAEYLDGPAVFACNHQSLIDGILMPAIAPAQIKFVAKKEIAKIPFFGWVLSKAGGVMIDRRNSRSAIEAIRRGVAKLPRGWSVAVFPEGTRSFSGELLPFKRGVCHIAMAAGLPVVPIGIDGAQRVMRKGDIMPRSGVVQVTAGPPIDTARWRKETVAHHSEEIFEAVQACMYASRRRLHERQRLDEDSAYPGMAA